MTKKIDLLVSNGAQVLTLNPDLATCDPKDTEAVALGVIIDGAVAVDGGVIVDVGPRERIAAKYNAEKTLDARGGMVTPGLVDPHTHVVFGGSRHLEFGMRAAGATYHEILAAGGGIHSTVRATREATEEELIELALPRLGTLMGFGVTTVEAKSGYGLDVDTELKVLRVIQKLSNMQPVRLVPTYLGAHVVPLEYKENRQAYVDLVAGEMIPKIAAGGLATGCDVFLDEGAFELEEARQILTAAKKHGLGAKIHAGQFTDKKGPELIAELGGLSADHLEQVSDEGVAAMARAGVVAVLLPGAAFSLGDHFPSGKRFIDAGVDVAVATDDNPGTSRTENLPLMAAMAVTRMGLSPSQAWKAITLTAARAIGLEQQIGSLAPKKSADLAIFKVSDFRIPLYHFGINQLRAVITAGEVATEE